MHTHTHTLELHRAARLQYGKETRQRALHAALDDLQTYLAAEGQVAIFDATNTTEERRRMLVRGGPAPGDGVCWALGDWRGGSEHLGAGGSEHLGAGGSGGSEHLGAGGRGGSKHLGAGGRGGSEHLGAGGSGGSEHLGAGDSGGSEHLGAGGSGGSEHIGAGGSGVSEHLGAGGSGGSEHLGAVIQHVPRGWDAGWEGSLISWMARAHRLCEFAVLIRYAARQSWPVA